MRDERRIHAPYGRLPIGPAGTDTQPSDLASPSRLQVALNPVAGPVDGKGVARTMTGATARVYVSPPPLRGTHYPAHAVSGFAQVEKDFAEELQR